MDSNAFTTCCALYGQRSRLSRNRQAVQLNHPFSIRLCKGSFCLAGEHDRYLDAWIGPTPHGHLDTALKDHVVGKERVQKGKSDCGIGRYGTVQTEGANQENFDE